MRSRQPKPGVKRKISYLNTNYTNDRFPRGDERRVPGRQRQSSAPQDPAEFVRKLNG